MTRYLLVHATTYTYDEPVSVSYGRAHLKPADRPGQNCLTSQLIISPGTEETSDHRDYFGNLSTFFCVRTAHTELVVTARSELVVERILHSRDQLPDYDWINATETVAPEVAEFLLPSGRIRPSGEVAAYAATVFTPGLDVGEAVWQLLHRIHTDFEYSSGATTVRTTLPQLLEKRAGVCQDFAHLAVACLRSVGLPARYVSGYLETQPPPGKAKLQGSDASHAWASVHLPDRGWVDFDPTNDQFVDNRYIVTAVGRDYGDVPPLKGVVLTDAKKSTMDVGVDVIRLE